MIFLKAFDYFNDPSINWNWVNTTTKRIIGPTTWIELFELKIWFDIKEIEAL